MAKYTQAQNKATQKYIKNNYDTINIRVKKGTKEIYKEYAKSQGKSLNSLVVDLLSETMQQNEKD